MSHQHRNVLAPLAQRRQADADDVQAMVEVLAKTPVGDARLEVLVGGGDDAHVDVDLLEAADAVETAVRQYAKQSRLQIGRHVADLVEEQRAAVGLFEAADAAVLRAGEGALLVAEEFRLEQLCGNGRGVDGHEGLVAAAAGAIQGARHEFLAGARLAADQNAHVGARQAPDDAKHLLH